MEKETRNNIQRATQKARSLLEKDYAEQLEGKFDIRMNGEIAPKAGEHLDERQRLIRQKIVATIHHLQPQMDSVAAAVDRYRREAAFTTLNRFVALKMLESRKLVQECISKGEQSSGFREFTGLAPGLAELPDKGYRLYLESLFDEIGQEVRVLFDRLDPVSFLWPRRPALLELLEILNDTELATVWGEDETIGWVYQYFNRDEERKQMRAESQAPRNSRELAVRNQFFTPRYVVEFLTDNTLGRIWYEMRQGNTRLVEECDYLVRRPVEVFLEAGETAPESLENSEAELSQEELLNQPVYIPFRPLKDPRDLKVLDPACGSGHFLLYAFDLLLTIYEESWALENAPHSEITGRTLQEDYASFEDLQAAIPSLILRHNLHGVEIDPRAAQIASLALWMRSQRAYQEMGFSRNARPQIQKTNVVVAEPMPGDESLVEEFAETLYPPVVGDLFWRIVKEMKLAGEAGSLLKIEESIASTVTEAREQYQRWQQELSKGYLPGFEPTTVQGELDLSGIDDVSFFQEMEGRIIGALKQYAEKAQNGQGFQRRLFAEDAARGFGFIDLCYYNYDVVLMNPPFGDGSNKAKEWLSNRYPNTKNDIYATFVERGINFLHYQGQLGAITSRTGFFLSSFQKWREEILLKKAPPTVFADLGYGVLDSAMVETAAYCLSKETRHKHHFKMTQALFLRLLQEEDKRKLLREKIEKIPHKKHFLEKNYESFQKIPGSPFAYWVSNKITDLFAKLPSFNGDGRSIKVGLQTGDDFRFLRCYWEVEIKAVNKLKANDVISNFVHNTFTGKIWLSFAKGGSFANFYQDIYLLIYWAKDGKSVKNHRSAVIRNEEFYYKKGITWTERTTSLFSARVLNPGTIFSVKGSAGFFNEEKLLALGLMNSKIFNQFLGLMVGAGDAAARSYQVGMIKSVPFPKTSNENIDSNVKSINHNVERAWSLKRRLDTITQTSHAFYLPALLQVTGDSLQDRARVWAEQVLTTNQEIDRIQDNIDSLAFELYGITPEDIGQTSIASTEKNNTESDEDSDSEEDNAEKSDLPSLLEALLEYSLGAAFGRFDLHLATGERPAPSEPDPFEPLPICSPGMLTDEEGLPPLEPPQDYPYLWNSTGILVDDQGHTWDLIHQIQQVFDVIFTEHSQQFWDETAKTLDSRHQNLRHWFVKNLFPLHIKRYSKSRRKAPIYWQLATPTASYSLWLYYHRFTRDTFYKALNDFVKPKLEYEERKLSSLTQSVGNNPTASQRKEIAAQETFVTELRTFRNEIETIAPLWNPNLNDGVIINFAPLWRLVPQNRSWQKECKACWDKLVKGDYDWAHLALHLWPERVIPKCQTDRSLAIAHDLEDIFWEEDDRGKWHPRTVEPATVENLIQEHTSPAVKDALKRLLEAPEPAGNRTRRTRRKTS